MKKILLTALIISSSLFAGAADEEETKVDSKISNVTVFLSGAQVYRDGSFYIQKGVSILALENVSPYVDRNTLMAKGKGEFTIMDVVFDTYYPKPDETIQTDEIPADVKRKINLLKDSITDITYELDELRAIKEVYTLERQMLLNNGTVKGTGKVNDSIPLLRDAMTFFHEKMTKINLELFALKKKEDKLVESKAGMDTRYQALLNWRQQLDPDKNDGPIYRILVTVHAEKPVRGQVEVGYIVSQAGWKPSYDLRAKSLNSPIELNYKAEVFQNTGIDWNEVPLVLSTSNPYARQQKPELSPWYLSFYNVQQQYYKDKADSYTRKRGEAMAEESEAVAYDDLGEMQNKLGSSGYGGASKPAANTAINYTQSAQNMVSAEYKINLPYTIKSNNKPYVVAVAQKELNADYNLALVPKIDKNAFLIASVTDWDDLNLIPAKARIYYDGTFVGQSFIDPTQMTDTLKLAMGRDNSVSAIRKKLKDKTKEKVIGDNKVNEFYYEISVKNAHGYSVEIIVEDQVPISNHADIKVEVLDKDKAELNEFTGILTWRTKLKAGGSEKYTFGYSIKHDKNKMISLAH